MEVTIQPPSGGWHTISINGKVVAMTVTERLAEILVATIKTRVLLGRNSGV